jgi:tetratricopeptide (TPR) repeat protein
MTRSLGWWLLLLATGCASSRTSVIRVVDGEELPGRFVSHLAYTAYARGAVLEADGDLNAAVDAYREALREDAESKEIWTRIGALHCQLGRPGAEDAFASAISLDPEYEPTWRERARCHLRQGKLRAALSEAQRALALDPSLQETSVLIATIFARLGRPKDARRVLEGLIAFSPGSVPGYEALLELATRTKDAPLRERAAHELARLSPRRQQELARLEPSLSLAARIDEALRERDLERAQELALEARMPGATLALRAAALGRADLAYELARRVLDADPQNGDAWVAAVAAADELRDEHAFATALASMARDMVPPGVDAIRLLADLLERRAGRTASQALRSAYGLGEGALVPAR